MGGMTCRFVVLPQTRHDDKTFHFAPSVSRGGRIISSIIIFTTAFYMLIFRTCNASPGSLAGRRNVSSEMALSNDEYAICSVIPRHDSNCEIRINDLIIYGIAVNINGFFAKRYECGAQIHIELA